MLRPGKTRQGDAGRFGHAHGQCSGRRHGYHATDAEHGRFGHHFIAGAAGNQHKALLPIDLPARTEAQQLVERIVAADVFKRMADNALLHPSRAVCGAGLAAQMLVLVQIGQSRLNIGCLNNAAAHHLRQIGLHRGEAVDAAQPAAAAPAHAAAARFQSLKALGSNFQMHFDAVAALLHVDIVSFACLLQNAFAQAEAQCQLR